MGVARHADGPATRRGFTWTSTAAPGPGCQASPDPDVRIATLTMAGPRGPAATPETLRGPRLPTVPLGAMARLDASEGRLTILESGVQG